MAQVTAIVDMAFDVEKETPEAVLAGIGAEFGIEGRIVQMVGPGGGWPEVELKGERASVEQALKDRGGMDDEDLAEGWMFEG